MATRKASPAKTPVAPKGKAAKSATKPATKANPLQAVIDDLNELALRDDVPTSYAGRLTAIANRIDSHLKRAGG